MKTIIAVMLALSATAVAPRVEPATDPPEPEAAAGAASITEPDSDGSVADAQRSVAGGKHDFSQRTGRPGDACSACHVPHVQGVRRAGQDSAEGDAILEMYRIGGQREVFVADRYMPGATSLICLSCHNGTVATSTMGSSHAVLGGNRAGFTLPDTYVFHDHPIGVPYPNEPRNYRPRGVAEGRGVAPPGGRVECISCHDPHGASGVDKMLVMSNRRSALCLACHIK